MKKIKTAGIFTRDPENKEIKKWHKELDKFLRNKNITAFPIITPRRKLKENPDIMIVLGGDGAILQAAKICAPRKIPILGLNLGTVGFLTTARKEENFIETLEMVLGGDYFAGKRMMLCVNVIREGKVIKTGLALNEIAVKNLRTVLEFDIFINDYKITEKPTRGDGVNICTPTGSTAYNLGLGGVIIEPEVECITIKHIAPISLNIRSIIIDKKKTVKVKLLNSRGNGNVLLLDGREIKLKINDIVEIKKSEVKTLLIRTKKSHFWDSMNDLFGLNK